MPWESFRDHIKKWGVGNDDTKDYLLVEVDEVIRGINVKLFEKTNDNNRVTNCIWGEGAPARAVPSFASSVAVMSIALLSLAVGSTPFTST